MKLEVRTQTVYVLSLDCDAYTILYTFFPLLKDFSPIVFVDLAIVRVSISIRIFFFSYYLEIVHNGI